MASKALTLNYAYSQAHTHTHVHIFLVRTSYFAYNKNVLETAGVNHVYSYTTCHCLLKNRESGGEKKRVRVEFHIKVTPADR